MPYLPPEQYFEIERGLDSKNEYIDGAMYAMSGGRPAHSQLGLGIGSLFRQRLLKRGCSVFSSDMQIGSAPQGPFLYPDASVVCGELILMPGRVDVLANPLVIVEVLSPSTEAYDRGKKFGYYRRLESFKEYVLISQTEPRVEVFSRSTDDKWDIAEYTGNDAVCRLRSVNCEIPLNELYEGVVLPQD